MTSRQKFRHAPITPLSPRQERAVRISKTLRETGIVTLIVSLISYPIMLLAVNQYGSHLIQQEKNHLGDPFSNAGLLIITFGTPLALAIIAAGAIISQHVGNRCESERWRIAKTIIKVGTLLPILVITAGAMFGAALIINNLMR